MNTMKLLRTGQVARRLGVSRACVAQLRDEGWLEGMWIPLGFLYREEVVSDFEKMRLCPRKRRSRWESEPGAIRGRHDA
jgi:hypothetical protein